MLMCVLIVAVGVLVVIIMMVSVLVQAMRMILTRKKDPLVTVGLGLLRYFLVNALGITLIAGALQASDALSSWLVAQSMNDFATHMQGLLSSAVLTNPFALLALAVYFPRRSQWEAWAHQA